MLSKALTATDPAMSHVSSINRLLPPYCAIVSRLQQAPINI